MTIDSEEGQVETQETETPETETETTPEVKEEPKEEKPKETPEQRVARLRRQLEREEKKLGVPKEEHIEKETRSGDLDYGEKAFLRSYDIKGSDELALVRQFRERTGDSLDSIVEDEFFQSKLSRLREARATAEAIPKGTRRSAQPSSDDASFWQSKIESGQATLNDITDVTVRREVLNRRIEKERVGSRFSDTPVQMT